MTDTIEFHPIANIFPMLPDRELQELAVDIRKHGLLTPILLFEDKVLDGRNRARACEMVDADAHYEVFKGDTTEAAVNYVLSSNLHRRHLTDIQKYEALKKASKIKENAKARQRNATIKGNKSRNINYFPVTAESAVTGSTESDKPDTCDIDRESETEGLIGREAASEFANVLDVSTRKVYRMEKILREAPEELTEMVREGKVSVDMAANVLTNIDKEELQQIVDETEQEELGSRLQAELTCSNGKSPCVSWGMKVGRLEEPSTLSQV